MDQSTRLRLKQDFDHLDNNPYAATSTQPIPDVRPPMRWRAVIGAAVVAFAVLPGLVLAVSLASGTAVPDFLSNLGFLGSLVLTSAVSALVCERARLAFLAHACLAAVLNLLLFALILVSLNYLTH